MREVSQFYIDGAWVAPLGTTILPVINPATEAIAAAVTEEMGAPRTLAHKSQARLGLDYLEAGAGVLRDFCFQEQRGSALLVKEPIGVCGFITPWNWPLNQIACKVVPALLTGCTMVLKPSEIAPFSAQVWSEVLHAAGVPAGVYNLVHGDGPTVGAALAAHPDVDMVFFTGSTRAGVEVARTAATTVKRVHQELGGKSPHIILEDADLEAAVNRGVASVMNNSGQSCNAPTRMLVPRQRMGEAAVRDMLAPFGGYKRSGNGREWGAHAFNEFLETKGRAGLGAVIEWTVAGAMLG